MSQPTNVTLLRERLQALLMSLERFDESMKTEFVTMDSAWRRLRDVWDGRAYQRFEGDWNQVRETIRAYNALSTRYERFLRERIESLERFERGDT